MRALRFMLIFAAALAFASGRGLAQEPPPPSPKPRPDTLIVFAAASMKEALDEIAAAFNPSVKKPVATSYAGSSQLARQIEQDAPADIFISADNDWMDYLQDKGLIQRGSRVELLSNRLVLVGGKDAKPIEIAPGFDLAGALKGGRLAMALVDAVPAGKYGKAALENLKVWDSVNDKVAQADNVRAALLLVSRGESPLGIVYATDALADKSVVTVGAFPEDSHPPIRYPVALTKKASPQAATFLDFLQSDEARSIFEERGFIVLR